jgi:hypothetical protein
LQTEPSQALELDSCAVCEQREASTFHIACCKFSQKHPRHPRLGGFFRYCAIVRERDEPPAEALASLFLLIFLAGNRFECAVRSATYDLLARAGNDQMTLLISKAAPDFP